MKTLRRAISSRDGLIWAAALLLLLTVCLPGYSAAVEGLIEPSPSPPAVKPALSSVEGEKAPTVQTPTPEKPLPQPVAQQPGGEPKPTLVEEAPKVAEPSIAAGSAEQQVAPPPSVPPKVPGDNRRLSLDFNDADLNEVLWRVFHEESGLSIVIAHGLKEPKDRLVTVRLINVEWRQALDVILRTKGLSYEQDGNVIYVGSKLEIQESKNKRAEEIEKAMKNNSRIEEVKQKIEEVKQKIEEARKKAEEEERRYAGASRCTAVMRLAHMKTPDMKKHLERLKTRYGRIDSEESTNTLIITDREPVCQEMAAHAKELDAPPKDPFVTKLLPFNYAKAADLKQHLAVLKTPQGSVVVDERSSRIIVKDLPEAVERIETFLKQIDIPTPQVLIEARIVEASRSFSQSLGIQWGGAGIPTTPGSGTGVTTFGGIGGTPPPSISFPPGMPFPPTTGGGAPFGPVPLALNLPAAAPQFVIGATIASLANRFLVGVQLSAAESDGRVRTLSSPRVATQDNEEAEIKQGTQVPFTTIDSSGRTVITFQDIFIKLKVKPHITPDGRVSIKVEAESSFPKEKFIGAFGVVFSIDTRKATTNILVQNGSTVVIGGLLKTDERVIEDRVPFLGRIPGLSWLFKRRSLGPDERVELLIFLTPSILQESRL